MFVVVARRVQCRALFAPSSSAPARALALASSAAAAAGARCAPLPLVSAARGAARGARRAPSAAAPARSFAAPSRAGGGGGGSDADKQSGALSELYMRALEPKPPARPPPLPEPARAAAAAAARTYVQLLWKRERVRSKDLHRKLLLKWAALYALPTDALRRDALRFDPAVPGLKTPRATPPLAGFAGAEERAEGEGGAGGGARAGAGAGAGARGGARRLPPGAGPRQRSRALDAEGSDDLPALTADATVEAAEAARLEDDDDGARRGGKGGRGGGGKGARR